MVQATIESFDNIRDFLFGFLRIATVVTWQITISGIGILGYPTAIHATATSCRIFMSSIGAMFVVPNHTVSAFAIFLPTKITKWQENRHWLKWYLNDKQLTSSRSYLCWSSSSNTYLRAAAPAADPGRIGKPLEHIYGTGLYSLPKKKWGKDVPGTVLHVLLPVMVFMLKGNVRSLVLMFFVMYVVRYFW